MIRSMEKLVLYLLGLQGHRVSTFPIRFLHLDAVTTCCDLIPSMPRSIPSIRFPFDAWEGGGADRGRTEWAGAPTWCTVLMPSALVESSTARAGSGANVLRGLARPECCHCQLPLVDSISQSPPRLSTGCGLHFPALPGAAW